jgi:CHAT domain-containing protein
VALVQQAAALGHAEACEVLGEYYKDGFGPIRKDEQKAIEILEPLAEAGRAEAKRLLGLIFWMGRRESHNPERAVALLREAAMMGYVRGFYSYSLALWFGVSGKRDRIEAGAWMLFAAKCGHKEASDTLDKLYGGEYDNRLLRCLWRFTRARRYKEWPQILGRFMEIKCRTSPLVYYPEDDLLYDQAEQYALAEEAYSRGLLWEAEPLLDHAVRGIEFFRGQGRAGLERAQMSEALSLETAVARLSLVRIKLGRVASLVFDASSVVDAIERGTSRAILDLVQPMSFEWGNLAAERHARGHWSKQELEHFTDVSRRANELQERLNNPSLPAEARKQLGEELTELRKDLLPLERELLPASSPRSLDQIRSVLRPGELVLLYSWASMAVTLVAIPAPGEGDVTCVILDEDKDRIQQAERAAKTCADGLSGRQKISEMLAAAKDFMSFAFPDSVRAVAARAERLVIIPSGPLHNVPVDVLAEIAEVPEVTDPQVVYAPSASIFAMLRERGQVNGPYDPTIVGDPDLRLAPDKSEPGQQRHTEDDPLGAVLQDTDRWKLKQLPHAGLEARRIAELFALRAGSEVKPLLGPDATVPAVHGHARGKRFLHLATHGQLAGPSDPMGSAIVLSKSKEANEPERFDPAPTTYDKLRLDTLLGWTGHLDGCELVTLSACQTSQGVRTGDSTMALPIGFFHAGARCVLASQWKVADDATGWLMERMYEGLLGLHDEERVVGGRRYPPGQQMPLPDALKEARTWLRNMTLGERNRRVKRAGMLNPAAHRAPAQTPATAAEPKTGSAEDPFDGPAESRPFHDTPYYWAAFVIVGDVGV